MKKHTFASLAARLAAQGGILVFFLMAFEIMIMISPFAFFFYSVFNPVFKFLGHSPATSWLTSFFLPHMILPPTPFLVGVRILGSLLFIGGLLTFVVSALQVYLGKILKWGIADKGLYRFIRHPQYLALGTWGVGMCILWPRFIVLVSLSMMFVLYLFLAKDEERRMTASYGDSYREYMRSTGMFTPPFASRWFSAIIPNNPIRNVAVAASIVTVIMASGFCLRGITLRSLPLATQSNVTLVSILPEDNKLSNHVLGSIIGIQSSEQSNMLKPDKDYLGYLMPADYVMQGMIANTGSDFHLFKQHHTLSMITEWVVHPFQHLRSSPSLHMAKMLHVSPEVARRHHCPIGINDPSLQCNSCPYRRVILVEVDHAAKGHLSGRDLFSFNTTRVPLCYVDVNALTGGIVAIKQVENATAWRDVPTPAI
jgi:protein-S-isoprenylcysteine O-methyltransferase Ste14